MQISLALDSALPISTSRSDAAQAGYTWNEDTFKQLIRSTALLPLYTFDDDSPFRTIGLTLLDDPAVSKSPPLLGSFLDPITDRSELVGSGSWQLNYAGDGVTKSFSIVIPTKASFYPVHKKELSEKPA